MTSGDPPTSPRRQRRTLGGGAFPALILTGSLVAGLLVVAAWTSIEVSSRPQFCGSCHIMQPYYQSWKQSRHASVACVECHIPPGVTAELRKKYEALSMVASYFTGTYGTNPWTEIDDAACLRCHERRLLSGKELFGDVLFDHTSHLSGMRRGKRLRCTSCHSQIVQGSHIAVTSSTCILCHFKGQTSGTGTARCTLCHHVPDRVIRHGTLTFSHADVERFGMDCTWCHARPSGSDGDVPRERCVTCHNQPSRLAKYNDIDLLHRMHVSEHKIDCMDCHLEIQHVGAPQVEKAAAACDTCHLKGHSAQMNLYAGLGGRGVDPTPSAMFLAGVRCEGCHIQVPGQHSEVRRASEVSCMSCHGASYRRIFLAWKEGIEGRTSALARQLAQTAPALGTAAAEALADARFNLDLVVRGRGVHNMAYARALLQKAHESMNRARSARGLATLPLPWQEVPYASPCLRCHQGIEAQSGTLFDRHFSHGPHLARARLECSSCHRTHEERAKGELVRFRADGCDSCHHRNAGADCSSCHGAVRQRLVPSARGEFSHALHVDEMEQACSACHDLRPGGAVRLNEDACGACH